MRDVVAFMQNVDAVAFLALGVVTAAIWLRDRDRSSGYLALAIVLLSVVLSLSRALTLLHITSPVVSFLNLLAFVGSGYALLSYRHSLIPLSRKWRIGTAAAMAATVAGYLVAMALSAPTSVLLWIAVALIGAWAGTVIEPIVRFWLVARGLPAVQAWRLRSLSLGFAALLGILLFALIMAGARVTTTNAATQFALQVVVLAIVPLLYVSFAPPAWLRREWRASEEEGLRAFMESLLVSETAATDRSALEWAMRLTGGGSAISFDSRGDVRASSGIDPDFAHELQELPPDLGSEVRRYERRSGQMVTLIALPIHSLEGIGRLVVVSGPFTPAIGNDEMNRVQQFMTSVTAGVDRRRLVKELKDANRELKEASEHKSVFLANMSHELRTPLNAIIGFSELMLDAKESQFDSATQKRFLSQVHASGKHLLGLINDILDLAKVEAGQMELRLQDVAVEPVIAQAVELVEPLAAEKRITIRSEASSVGAVLADAGKLKQMLLNLVSNAIKFTAEGGTVTITARRLPGVIEIAVADTGIGISDADQAKIFVEFHQVDPGPGRRQQGTGLGLALTRRFALLHGGDVRVTSKVGAGSVFTLRLPLQVAAVVPADEKVDGAAAADPSRPLILIIEDDVAAAELLTRQLQAAGFRTHVARTGTEAIAKARALHPAAITLDILLPELDGWEVITRLKREEETSSIPVVVVSVVDNPELGKALGALDYFVKPVDGKLLVDRLRGLKLKTAVEGAATSVMVVDDEPANRQWLARILEPAGFEVIEAAGGREAIELAKARAPDLVLLDLMMPEVTGFDVVEALRADPRTSQTPIMILTARHLTEADKRHLNGHVSTILSRGSLGAADLLGLLQQVVVKANGKPAPTK
jgi:signal transduction histidine kinase/CheY-like chemotaxis protein